MIHILIDDEIENSKRKFACGIGPELPTGDLYYYESQALDFKIDCPICKPFARVLGTPISQLSGRPGHSGYNEFCRIAKSWGYD